MAQLAIRGHATRSKEVIEILKMLGGKNDNHCCGGFINRIYFINENGYIEGIDKMHHLDYFQLSLEEFLEEFPYKVGDKVRTIYGKIGIISKPIWSTRDDCIRYELEADIDSFYFVNELQPYKEETKPEDMGEVSDGYHTFNELYEYRMLYNAALFNEFAKQGLYDVHKSRKHSDGEYPFGDSNWFIVMAELPTGQISNHYEMKDWDKFQIPEKPLANKWDEHSPRDVADRLTSFTNPKKEYPKTYVECAKLLGCFGAAHIDGYKGELLDKFQELLICRDAYWMVYGEENKLGKPWEPDWCDDDTVKYCIIVECGIISKQKFRNYQCILAFPTKEMRDVFFENFKDLIEQCKELL